MLFPFCSANYILMPCKNICVSVKADCHCTFMLHRREWPEYLNCSSFPSAPDLCLWPSSSPSSRNSSFTTLSPSNHSRPTITTSFPVISLAPLFLLLLVFAFFFPLVFVLFSRSTSNKSHQCYTICSTATITSYFTPVFAMWELGATSTTICYSSSSSTASKKETPNWDIVWEFQLVRRNQTKLLNCGRCHQECLENSLCSSKLHTFDSVIMEKYIIVTLVFTVN